LKIERLEGGACAPPFPVHEGLVARLLAAHGPDAGHRADRRDETVAHVLATCAGYAYADTPTVALVLTRLGLEPGACVSINQTVDAMFIFSTAFLVQSRCGRVVILCYRGTEPATFGSWLGDADIGPEVIALGGERLTVHAGFHRNVRATRWAVLQELAKALDGFSLLDPSRQVDHPLEALYITGHSLGGAMALLFALSLGGSAEHRPLAERLRAVYTYGQPMALIEPIPEIAAHMAKHVFRHILTRDFVPALPPAQWGRFMHIGDEYRYADGAWRRAATPVAALQHVRDIPRSLLGFFATGKRAERARWAARDHGPHHYIAALRPAGRVTEFGDWE
jgi:hypothetical protein